MGDGRIMCKTKIKGLFFDFDGVLTVEKYGTPTMIAYISEKTGLPYKKVDIEYRKYNEDLLRGKITHKAIWHSFCEAVGMDIDHTVLEESFLNVTLDRHMITLIRKYKQKYLIGMITDNKADRIDTVIKKTELNGLFDVVIISANVHARKSEKKIFHEALSGSGLKAEECFFIDNTKDNLIVPNEMGFKTYFFDDAKRDHSDLESVLLQFNV